MVRVWGVRQSNPVASLLGNGPIVRVERFSLVDGLRASGPLGLAERGGCHWPSFSLHPLIVPIVSPIEWASGPGEEKEVYADD